MPRIDHVAVESSQPDECAAFYERFLGARIVRTEGHPVMAYLESGAMAIHEQDGPGTMSHSASRRSSARRSSVP